MLVGDFLFSRAFQIIVADGSLRILKILSDASALIAEGEVMQLLTTNDTKTSEEAYLDVIRAKTATLFAAAASVGAVVAERPQAEEQVVGIDGRHFSGVDQVRDHRALLVHPVAQLGLQILRDLLCAVDDFVGEHL